MSIEMIFAGAVVVSTLILALLVYKGGAERRKIATALGISEKTTERNQIIRGVSSPLLIILLAIGVLVPVVQGREEITLRTGEVLFLADESRSMAAENPLGRPNRLERAKKIMISFVDSFPHLIVRIDGFTREVRSHLFWTNDYDDFRRTVRGVISIEGVPTNGTDMGKAVDRAVNYFSAESESKTIVLLSDGENGGNDNLLTDALNSAKRKKVKIIVIGVGEKEGLSIPIYNGKGKLLGFEEESGRQVITFLNQRLLKEIALRTDGIYIEENDLEKAFQFLDQQLIEKKKSMIAEDTTLRKYLLLVSLVPLFFVIIKNW